MPLSEALSLRRSPRTTLSPPPHGPSKPTRTKQPLSSSSNPAMPRRSPRLTLSPSSPPTQQTLALTLCGQPVVVVEEEEDPEPQPLKIYHPNLKSSKPHKLKLHLLHASSSSAKKTLRRSPRLMGASVGLVNGKCGSELLLKLPEKEACKLARKCLDDNDLNVKCLRSRNLRSPSHWASTVSPFHCKRKFDSGQNSDETPVNRETPRRSSRFSGEKGVDSSENEGKCTKLDYRRSSDEASVNRGFPRRSPRFSGDNAGESKDVRLALPSSSMLEKPEKLMKRDARRRSGIPGKMPENTELPRRSMRFSGETVESPTRKEIINEFEGKLGKTSEGVVLSSPNSSMAREFGKSQGHSPSLSSEKAVQSSACSELAVKTRGRSEDTPLPLTLSSVMEEIFGKFEEERVLRRSPRGLSSICLVDDYQCDEMKEMPLPSPKKKKKKKEKEKKKEQENVAKDRRDKSKVSGSSTSAIDHDKEDLSEDKSCFFVGEAVPEEEAHQRWGWRYQLKNRRSKERSLTANADEEDESIVKVKCHYTKAQINGCIFHLGDCALIRGEEGQEHVGRVLEFFQTMEGDDYFRVQWFYRAEDTVLKEVSLHDKNRVFCSTVMNDNVLDCIISKLNVAQITPKLILKMGSVPSSDFYYDMEYCLDYSTFRNLPRDISVKGSELSSISCPEPLVSVNATATATATCLLDNTSICEPCNAELTMLDVYAGCGAMSTGLRIGAKLSGVNLMTRWAIDYDHSACESLRLNHPETHVKNEAAEDFLELLKHWEKLCKNFVTKDLETYVSSPESASYATEMNLDAQSGSDISDEELEALSLVDICFGDAVESGKCGLKFKVRWKGYDPSEDTWEPIEGLSNCEELIQEFVINGFRNKILPLPGDVDVICGGPPCQGISGYNRFRCIDDPLSDEKNRQLIVFMDIVEFLKPKFVLMENVTDILRFDKGSLGRYALSRLVHMNYQARVGIMAAGCYGLPQFRLRVFFWGALPSEELPQFPLPTHDVVVRYWPPPEFERNVVAYDEGQPLELDDAVLLTDAISDLPPVTNCESSDEMQYSKPPETKFQKYIRSMNYEMIGSDITKQEAILYDHRPHQLFEDDYIRVCQIPRRKGANFRDLSGIVVGDDNVVRRDPNTKAVLLPAGRPLVPEYVFTFEHGKSKRPFGRLWWDETMATVVTYPNCHSQVVLHPEQDRVLTVRECARLQGFPDDYRFCGTVKERYRQVGNAVAIPVAKALGYALGIASQKLIGKEPLMTLPPKFAYSNRL